MAKIVPSKDAPNEEVFYSLGAEDEAFTLGPGGSVDSPSRGLLAEAEAHPWLEAEYDADEGGVGVFREPYPLPKDDAFAEENTKAFDPELVKETREEVLAQSAPEPGAVEETPAPKAEPVTPIEPPKSEEKVTF